MGKAHLCLSLMIIAFAFVKAAEEEEEEIGIYELQKGHFSLNITNYGATLLSLVVPDTNGKLDDIVLGYGSIDDYKNGSTYFGAIVGRVANRIGGAKFELNGKSYKLPANDNGNTLHGGKIGYNKVIWTVKRYVKNSHITLTYDSHDGEQGFPGKVSITVTYSIIGSNKLGIKMKAKSINKSTPINLASHTYWNLGGHTSGNILSHTIHLHASKITPVDDELIPTGEIAPVRGLPYDFLEPHTIGSRFDKLQDGYDINYVLDKDGVSTRKHLTRAAVVRDGKSGRKIELWTNQVGVQFYSGNKLKNVVGKNGAVYRAHDGLCLETQGFPDAVNHPNFPSQIVNPGGNYKHVMIYRFTAT